MHQAWQAFFCTALAKTLFLATGSYPLGRVPKFTRYRRVRGREGTLFRTSRRFVFTLTPSVKDKEAKITLPSQSPKCSMLEHSSVRAPSTRETDSYPILIYYSSVEDIRSPAWPCRLTHATCHVDTKMLAAAAFDARCCFIDTHSFFRFWHKFSD